ncbi:MAG: hypothetical protein ACP5NZ_02080 [Nanobdellota archaeon]
MIIKTRRILKIGISFWAGVGLMSIFNIWKIIENQNALNYSWIMLFTSILLMIIGVVYLLVINQNKR